MTIRIPTLLAILILVVAVILGGILLSYRENVRNTLRKINSPKNIQVANIGENSATIIWQTDALTQSEIIYGIKQLGQSALDERGSKKNLVRLTHFVVLKNLAPSTSYTYKIKLAQFEYPDKPLTFTTARRLIDQPSTDKSPLVLNPPLRGSVIEKNLDPVDEAIVVLAIPGVSSVAAPTVTAGNFIVPLTKLISSDLKELYILKPKTEGRLEILKGSSKSIINLILPISDFSLPAIKLGQNYDLRETLASQSASPIKPIQISKFDLNSDGEINSIDLSILLDNIKKAPRSKNGDLNEDGVIDQKDVELIKKSLS